MAPSMPTMPKWRFVIPDGNDPKPSLTAAIVKPKMPSGFPINKPRKTPVGTAKDEAASAAPPPKATAQLANANNGRITKAQKGAHRLINRSTTSSPLRECIGTHSAIRTPATSAHKPLRSMKYQRRTPGTKYDRADLRTPTMHWPTPMHNAPRDAHKYFVTMAPAKHTAMTKMAPKSSTVASASKKEPVAAGMWALNAWYTPIAKAMSVAMGMVTPDMDPPGITLFTA
mmetsp:Transcript_5849/g.12818  ORF Transcript_5849/g.12818 Transcript_5849/m.12818 type:complete len:228 (-) Transcript_5849:761-1444(-)